jgi:hypothetical protein
VACVVERKPLEKTVKKAEKTFLENQNALSVKSLGSSKAATVKCSIKSPLLIKFRKSNDASSPKTYEQRFKAMM